MTAFDDLLQSIVENEAAWQNYYESTHQNEFNQPTELNKAELTQFQKLMLFRCFQLQKLPVILRQFVHDVLRNEFVVSPPFDLASAFADSTCCKPLLFILSNYDPIKSIRQFAKTQLVGDNRLITVSLGQQQSPLAMKSIEAAIKSGDWIILQNCHLAGDFLNTIERICDSLAPDTTHPDFRLWLTTKAMTNFPLSILQHCIKLVNEPPQPIRSTLLRTFTSQSSELENYLDECKKPEQLKRLMYSVSFLHAAIRERRQFGAIGWNNPYDFNENDLHLTIDQIFMLLNAFDVIPFDIVQTLMSECNYGGHIADSFDKKCLKVFAELFCTAVQCETGKPTNQILSDIDAYFPHDYNTIESIVRHINGLTDTMNASVYGLHQNVNVIREESETNDFLASIILTQVNSMLCVHCYTDFLTKTHNENPYLLNSFVCFPFIFRTLLTKE